LSSVSSWYARRFLAFVHIEKAAGTTFIHMLRRNFFLRYLDVRPYSLASSGVFTARDLELSLRINPRLCAFGGHAVRPLGDLCDVFPNIRFVTILRDPVRRYISQFLYGNAVLNLKMTFEQFLADEHTHDFQTRKIAGHADLHLAKAILKERFLTVGLVEQYDQFLSILADRLEPERFICAYETRNAGSYPREEVELFGTYESAIREVNQVDAALYRHVQKQLGADNGCLGRNLHSVRTMGIGDHMKYYADGALRKAFYEPVTGLLRFRNGLPMKGSY
jgi:hypothetical protein